MYGLFCDIGAATMNAIAKITAASLINVRKNLNFVSQSTPKHWFDNDPFKSRVADSLQLVFPDGERYFIESVRAYRDDITDEQLKADVADFIMQEAQHGMAHDHVNQKLKEQGVPVERMIGLAKKIMKQLESLLISKKIFLSRLETGPYSKDAISLYKKLGYSICGKFGSYKDDQLSTFMEKKLCKK